MDSYQISKMNQWEKKKERIIYCDSFFSYSSHIHILKMKNLVKGVILLQQKTNETPVSYKCLSYILHLPCKNCGPARKREFLLYREGEGCLSSQLILAW